MVTSKDVWKLHNSRVIVQFDENSGQPTGDSGGLLGSWLGQLSNDVNLLPINYSDWRMVNTHTKRKAWDVIQVASAINSSLYIFLIKYCLIYMNCWIFFFSPSSGLMIQR